MNGNTFFAVFGKITLVLMVMGAVAYAAYTFGASHGTAPIPSTNPVRSAAPADSAAATTPSPKPAASVDETGTLVAAVKAGLVAEHGADAASMAITVSTLSSDYAKGMASAGAGGGIWFAAKTGGSWHLVWDGNGIIDCTALVPYPTFPTSLIPECYNTATQKLVTR